jgi:hypothetical protein
MFEGMIVPKVANDRSKDFSVVRGSRETDHPRDINLIIDLVGTAFEIRVQTPLKSFDTKKNWHDTLSLTRDLLWGEAQKIRQAWHDAAVDFRKGGAYPLQEKWDFSSDLSLRPELLPKLARAGALLFRAIFFPRDPGDPRKYQRLHEIGEILKKESRQKSLWIRVTSGQFYAPWNLIYSEDLDDDGSNATPQGFWGYQHVIEQAPGDAALEKDLDFDEPLQIGLQLDENIDTKLNVACNDPILNLLSSYEDGAINTVPRNRSEDFKKALRATQLLDHILYFCCHAVAEGDSTALRIGESHFSLTDDVDITPADMDLCLKENVFKRGPIVFFNACQGAQLNSVFYQGFASTFLSRDASAVIGPQTEMPAVFAGEFARRFLEAFFSGGYDGKGNLVRQVGSILWSLRREFLDQYNNPLGFLYSLYRGADVFLPKPLAKRSSN